MPDHDGYDPLKECTETVERLAEENDHLRRAAGAFGQLAERLNHALKEERSEAERRKNSPPNPGRRSPSA
jgi:hypothetical protein